MGWTRGHKPNFPVEVNINVLMLMEIFKYRQANKDGIWSRTLLEK